jgi:hypothetical protein
MDSRDAPNDFLTIDHKNHFILRRSTLPPSLSPVRLALPWPEEDLERRTFARPAINPDCAFVPSHDSRELLGNPAWLSEQPGGADIAAILSKCHEALEPAGRKLRELEQHSGLGRSLDVVCGLFVHLHVNRMSGPEVVDEQRF